MPATLHKPRRARFAMFAVAGATALSIAACSSNTASPPSSTSAPSSSAPSSSGTAPTTTSSAPHNAESHFTGLVESVSGDTAQVNSQEKGKATVGFSSSTKVSEVTQAALTDVTPGSCVSVQPAHEGGQAVTAASVRISQAVDGKCEEATESGPSSTPPSSTPSSSPTTTSPSTPPARLHSQIKGTVASVSGNTINITSTDGNSTQTAVTVNDKTKYTKQTPTDTKAITVGKCLTAWGTKDGSGTLQATRIELVAHSAKCEGRPHHGG